jgi:hypothetical protein
MAEERLQRRLAAILSADVVGYSRLMGLAAGAALTGSVGAEGLDLMPTGASSKFANAYVRAAGLRFGAAALRLSECSCRYWKSLRCCSEVQIVL